MVNQKVMKNIIVIRGVSERICYLKLKVQKNINLLIIQVYAPTLDAEETEREKFYEDLERVLQKENEYYKIVMGDWNGKIGGDNTEIEEMGKHGTGKRNKNGKRVIEFAVKNNMKIANTFFRKKEKRKWTWVSPDQKTKNEIDHMLVNDLSIIEDVSTLARFEFSSDHMISRGRVAFTKRMMYNKSRKKETIVRREVPISRIQELRETFVQKLEWTTTQNLKVQEMYNKIEGTMRAVIKQYGENRKREYTDDKLSNETKQLLEAKKRMNIKANKTAKEKIEATELQKTVKKMIRRDIQKFETQRIQQILEEKGSTKQVRKELSRGRNLIIFVEERRRGQGTWKTGNCRDSDTILRKIIQEEGRQRYE